jgi:T-complex protein 1 subunit theta
MPEGKPSMKADSVRIVKLIGGNINQSEVVHGMLLPRSVEGTITSVENAKITVFGCGLESEGTETQGTVLIRNAEDMLNYNKSEEKSLEEVIAAIAATGTNCVVSGGTVSEMALHFLEKYKLMCIKVQSKWDLRRLCATVGATALVRMGPATPEEMGKCHKVYMKEYGTKKVTLFEQAGSEDTLVASIVLRSSVVSVINDLERACEDGLSTVQHMCKDASFLPGAGAFEMEMASRLRTLANETDSLDQYAIRKFGEAFETIPRVLAVNSGQPSTMLVSSLYAAHGNDESSSEMKNNETGEVVKGANVGVNIKGGVLDAKNAGIYDLMVTKESGVRLSVDAALTVLRVDQIIMSKQAGGPKPPAQR